MISWYRRDEVAARRSGETRERRARDGLGAWERTRRRMSQGRGREKGMICFDAMSVSFLFKSDREGYGEDAPLAGWAARMAVWRRACDERMQACRG